MSSRKNSLMVEWLRKRRVCLEKEEDGVSKVQDAVTSAEGACLDAKREPRTEWLGKLQPSIHFHQQIHRASASSMFAAGLS